MHPSYVAVVGPSMPEDEAVVEAAREGGRLLAERGHIVVTGGLGGVMAAAVTGAKQAGGTTLAILPGMRREDAWPGNDIAIPTGMGEMRNALIVRTADAVLAVGGAWGTLSEIALAARTGVPVFAVDSWDLPGPEVLACATVAEAVERLTAALGH
ncbi:MAG TPA: TIGR00725 family protein [Nocardioidaceae bacterium]|nr:TIGR00725 family protein [Nocardioidaceae bacterium]